MLRRIAVSALALWALAACAASNADEAKIRKILQGKFPTMQVESVTKSPFAGLYEVVLDGEVVYTDEKVEYFFGGNIYDIRTLPPRNLTQERNDQMLVSLLNGSLDNAIKRVKGSGKRTLYTFEDPNCGYCKQLSRELDKFHYIPTLSREKWEGCSGYVHNVYEDLCAEKPAAKFYLCGWKAMIDEARKRITELGYDRKAIHLELYG